MRTLTITKRVIKQILGDKRSIALLFIAPIFVLFLLKTILANPVTKVDLECINLPNDMISSLKKEGSVKEVGNEQEALEKLKKRQIDGLLIYKDNKLNVFLEGSENSITASVKKSVSKVLGEYMQTMLQGNPNLIHMGISAVGQEYIYLNGSDNMSTFDTIAPLMMGFFIFFFVFLMAGVAFLRERISGTLDRLMATPIRRMEIVLGYFLGFGVFVILQTIVIQIYMTYGLGITIKGSRGLVLLINILLAAGSLSLGTLLSAFAKNEFQLFQFIPVVIVPQILFSGLFSLREAPIWVKGLSKIFPLTYGADALNSVVTRGATFSEVGIDIAIIGGYAVLFIVLNGLALKKYRRL